MRKTTNNYFLIILHTVNCSTSGILGTMKPAG